MSLLKDMGGLKDDSIGQSVSKKKEESLDDPKDVMPGVMQKIGNMGMSDKVKHSLSTLITSLQNGEAEGAVDAMQRIVATSSNAEEHPKEYGYYKGDSILLKAKIEDAETEQELRSKVNDVMSQIGTLMKDKDISMTHEAYIHTVGKLLKVIQNSVFLPEEAIATIKQEIDAEKDKALSEEHMHDHFTHVNGDGSYFVEKTIEIPGDTTKKPM